MTITVGDGKYTVTDVPGHGSKGLHALRYGEPWRDCVGDKMIYQLAAELEEAREKEKHFDDLLVISSNLNEQVKELGGNGDLGLRCLKEKLNKS